MKVEAECPGCESTLGLKVEHSLASLIGNKVEDLLADESNQVRCPVCKEWVNPDNAEQVD